MVTHKLPRTDSITNNSTDINYDSKFNNLSIKIPQITNPIKEFKSEKSSSGEASLEIENFEKTNKSEISVYETPEEQFYDNKSDITVSKIDEIFTNVIKRYIGNYQNEFILESPGSIKNTAFSEDKIVNPLNREIDIQFFKNYYKQIFVRVKFI
jgi:hypothetical protein